MTRRRRLHRWVFLVLAIAAIVLVALALAGALAGEGVRALLSGLCHQRAERTLHVGGEPLGLCARCVGLYLGFAAFAFPYLLARPRAPLRRVALLSWAGPVGFGLEVSSGGVPCSELRLLVGLGLGVWMAASVAWLLRS